MARRGGGYWGRREGRMVDERVRERKKSKRRQWNEWREGRAEEERVRVRESRGETTERNDNFKRQEEAEVGGRVCVCKGGRESEDDSRSLK